MRYSVFIAIGLMLVVSFQNCGRVKSTQAQMQNDGGNSSGSDEAGSLEGGEGASGAPSSEVSENPLTGEATRLAQYNPCGSGKCEVIAPLVVTKDNAVVENIKVTSATGVCVEIKAKNVEIRNSEIGPCLHQGIKSWSEGLKVNGSYIHDTGREGVYAYNIQNAHLTRNRIERVSAGFRFVASKNIVVDHNYVKNVLGSSTGQSTLMGNVVQFDKVTGSNNLIRCNVGINELGKSYPEDLINMYGSRGEVSGLIRIESNKLMGGGPSTSGGGILLGDGNGSYSIAKKNVLIDPGQYGVGVAGGHHQILTENIIYARAQAFTNVGIYIWDLYGSKDCHSNEVTQNTVNYQKANGSQNDFWSAGDCGPIVGIGPTQPQGTNKWKANIGVEQFDRVLIECATP